MFGCLGRIGCLAVLLVVGGAAWLTRDEWYPRVFGGSADEASAVSPAWEPMTPEAAAAGRRKVARLSERRGPSAVALRPAEVAGYILEDVLRQLSTSAEAVEAAVVGDRVYVRAALRLRDLGGDVLGPLGGMLGERDTLLLGGTLDVVRPELAQFRVAEVKIGDFALPPAVVPRLLRALYRGQARPAGLAENALPLVIPADIADVRVARGRVTVYEEAQP